MYFLAQLSTEGEIVVVRPEAEPPVRLVPRVVHGPVLWVAEEDMVGAYAHHGAVFAMSCDVGAVRRAGERVIQKPETCEGC